MKNRTASTMALLPTVIGIALACNKEPPRNRGGDVPVTTATQTRRDMPIAGDVDAHNVIVDNGDLFVAAVRSGLSVQRMRVDGQVSWTRDFASKGFIDVHNGRVLVVEFLPPPRGGRNHVEILRASDGTTISDFETPLRVTLSAKGDAVVLCHDPFNDEFYDKPQPEIVVRNLDSSETREVKSSVNIGSAVALDFNDVIVQRMDGVVERYDASRLVWSLDGSPLTHARTNRVGVSVLAPILLSPRGSFVLVKEELGFHVVDALSGEIVFDHEPWTGDALSPLNLRQAVTEGLRNGSLRGAPEQVAAGLTPSFDTDESLIFRSQFESLPDVRLNLRNRTITHRDPLNEVRRMLESGSGPLAAAVRGSKDFRQTEQDGVRVTIVPGHLIVESTSLWP